MTLVIVVSGIVVPLLIQQLSQLAAAIPDAYLWVSKVAVPYLQTQLSLSPVSLPTIDWQTSLSEHWQSVSQVTGGVVQRVTTSSLSLIALLLNLALIPVVAFYLMRDWDLMMAGLLKLVPRVWASTVQASVSEAHTVLEAFLRGQLVVMGAQALMYSIGLWVVGLNYAVVLGVTAGIASLIPYAGSVIGVGSAMIVAYFQYGIDPWSLGTVALVFLIGQLIESFLLTPILVGDRIGLHPVAVIFALMAGGQLAGFTGVLIALPVAAVLLVFGRRIVEVYLSTDAYNAE
jgi:predicted PurR-regulated permease PerM